VDIGPLQRSNWKRFSTLTFLGSVPKQQTLLQMGLVEGAPQVSFDNRRCLVADERLRVGSGSAQFRKPIAHQNQLDDEGALFIVTDGQSGSNLHVIKDSAQTSFGVPNSFSKVEVDLMDQTLVYGVVPGYCLGSMHAARTTTAAGPTLLGVVEATPVYSLCRFSTETGELAQIFAWFAPLEIELGTAAFDPFLQRYYVVRFNESSNGSSIEGVQVISKLSTGWLPIPPEVTGFNNELFYDVDTQGLYLAAVRDGTTHILSADIDAQVLNSQATQTTKGRTQLFSLISHFEPYDNVNMGNFWTHDSPAGLRYRSLMYEATTRTHELLEVDVISNTSRFELLADIIGPTITSLHLLDTETELHHRFRSCHGRHCSVVGGSLLDTMGAPSIMYLGDFHKLTFANSPLEVDIEIDDLNTPIEELVVWVETSNPHLIRDSDIATFGAGHKRRMTLTPRRNQTGVARLTVFLSDGADVSRTSFMFFVGKHKTVCAVSPPHTQGCEYTTADLDPSENSRLLGVETVVVAGQQLRFSVQSVNHFGLDMLTSPNFLASACAHEWLRDEECSTVYEVAAHTFNHNVSADVAYLGRGIYEVVSEAVLKATVYSVVVKTFEGPDIVGSPFAVRVIPNALHPASCQFFGTSSRTLVHGHALGTTSVIEGDGISEIMIWARDRYGNSRPPLTDHLAFDLRPTNSTRSQSANERNESFVGYVMGGSNSTARIDWDQADVLPDPLPAHGPIYTFSYQFHGPIYTQRIAMCRSVSQYAAVDAATLQPGTFNADTEVLPEAALAGTNSSSAHVDGHTVTVGACRGVDTELVHTFDIYVIPQNFVENSGNQQLNTKSSYLFQDRRCLDFATALGSNYTTCSLTNHSIWTGSSSWDNASNTTVYQSVCAPVTAGDRAVFYLQSVDEYSRPLTAEDVRASPTLRASTIGIDANVTHIKAYATHFASITYLQGGVYALTVLVSQAGWQPITFAARGQVHWNSPFYVQVVAGALSAAVSFCDGEGTVKATDGDRHTFPEGNILYIQARDAYHNVRDSATDMFAMDPLHRTDFFYAEMSYQGGGTTAVQFWWKAVYYVDYRICVREHAGDPIGQYGACVWSRSGGGGNPLFQFDITRNTGCSLAADLAQMMVDNVAQCVAHCLDEPSCVAFEHIYAGRQAGLCSFFADSNADSNLVARAGINFYLSFGHEDVSHRIIQSPMILVLVNQGSKYSDPDKTGMLCLNNIMDDTACALRTGHAGQVSSFSIEARNELNFPNYRGEDSFTATISGPEDLNPLTVSHTFIQYYTLAYTPTVAGTYTLHINLFVNRLGFREMSASPITVQVEPGVANPADSFFVFPPTFAVDDLNGINIYIKDRFNNTCELDVGQILNVFTHSVFFDDYYFPVNNTATHGQFVSQAILRHSGLYNISVMIWVQQQVWPFNFMHYHIANSPETIYLTPGPFSPQHTYIWNFLTYQPINGTNKMIFQTQDAFGNNINQTGVYFNITFLAQHGSPPIMVPPGTRSEILRDTQHHDLPTRIGQDGTIHYGGTYAVPFPARTVGSYKVQVLIGLDVQHLTSLCFRSTSVTQSCSTAPFDLHLIAAEPAFAWTSGSGMTGCTAGVQAPFSFVLRDRFQNPCLRSFTPSMRLTLQFGNSSTVVLEATSVNGPRRPWSVEQTIVADDPVSPNGVYHGTYTLTHAGQYAPTFFADDSQLGIKLGGQTVTAHTFMVTYGDLGRSSVENWRCRNLLVCADGSTVYTSAGSILSMTVQLLDAYQNIRTVDDAVVQISVQELSASGTWEDVTIPYWGSRYTSGGQYEVDIQLTSAGNVRLWVRVRTAASTTSPLFTVIEDSYHDDNTGIPLSVKSGTPDPSSCYTPCSITQRFQVADRAVCRIEMYDAFGNRNRIASGLANDIALDLVGPTTIQGVAEWDSGDQTYRVEYSTLISGNYMLEIKLFGVQLNAPVTATVVWADVNVSTTTASGLGTIRTEPGALSEIAIQARDLYMNMVQDVDASRFTVNISRLSRSASSATLPPNFAMGQGVSYSYQADNSGNNLYPDICQCQLNDGIIRGDKISQTNVEGSVGFVNINPEVTFDLTTIVSYDRVRVHVAGGVPQQSVAAPITVQVMGKNSASSAFVELAVQRNISDAEQWVDIQCRNASRYVKVVLHRRAPASLGAQSWVIFGEIEILGRYGVCDWTQLPRATGGGAVDVEYQFEYDPVSPLSLPVHRSDGVVLPGSPTTFCGNWPVAFDSIKYSLSVAYDGQPLDVSPVLIRLGHFVPPSHRPYLVDANFTAPCGSPQGLNPAATFLPANATTMLCHKLPGKLADVVLVAGGTYTVRYHSVYSEGYPGCVGDNCNVAVDDQTHTQIQLSTGQAKTFQLQVIRSTSSTMVDQGPTFSTTTSRTRGFYTASMMLNLAEKYSVKIVDLSSGDAVDGTPFNITIVPSVAQANNSILEGATLPAVVDVPTAFNVTTSDRFGNARGGGSDTVVMSFTSGAAGVTSTTWVLDALKFSVQYTAHVTDIRGFVNFNLDVNGDSVAANDYAAPCAAGNIHVKSELEGKRSDPTMQQNGASNVRSTGTLAAGSTENMRVQARDVYGNARTRGGDASSIACNVLQPNLQPVAAVSIIDMGSGIYDISFSVKQAGSHQIYISILVNGTSLPMLGRSIPSLPNPLLLTVVPASLSPGRSYAIVPTTGDVATDFNVAVVPKDAFNNTISASNIPVGCRFDVSISQRRFGSTASPTQIMAQWSVSGDIGLLVTYLLQDGAVYTIDDVRQGLYTIHLRPGVAVAGNSLITVGANRTIDCIAYMPAEMTVQTRDMYNNPCESALPAGDTFEVSVAQCMPPMDASCTQWSSATTGSSTWIERGLYRLSYQVVNTGYYHLEIRFGTSRHLFNSPFTVLADAAAVPALSTANGTGLRTIQASLSTSLTLAAMGGNSSNPVARVGSGDIFNVTIIGGGECNSTECNIGIPCNACFEELPTVTYVGQGTYQCTYIASSSGHTTRSWVFELKIVMWNVASMAFEEIQGSPFTVTMVPDVTAPQFSFATGTGLHSAAAGGIGSVVVQGADSFNNYVFSCVTGFSGSIRRVVIGAGATNVTNLTAIGCSAGSYSLEYSKTVAGDYILMLTYKRDPIHGAPFRLKVTSAAAAGVSSFVSLSPADNAAPMQSGDMHPATAGKPFKLYLHKYDIYRNRLTQACGLGSTCTFAEMKWCQRSTNLSLVTLADHASCKLRAAVPVLTNFTEYKSGVYNMTATLTRSGTYSSAYSVQSSHAREYLANSNILITVIPAAATAVTTIATPPQQGMADELFTFSVRPHDQFNNFVVDDQLNFTVQMQFPNGAPTQVDSQTNQLVAQEPSNVSYGLPQLMYDDMGELQAGQPTKFDGTYTAYCRVGTGGKPALLSISIFLEGISIGSPFSVQLKVALNVPQLSYVITSTVGPPEVRALNLSRDLRNLDRKVAGEPMFATVQSMIAAGPRQGLTQICNATEVVLVQQGAIMQCEELDEFSLFLQRVDDAGYSVGPFTATCGVALRPSNVSEWQPNDCGRVGQYSLSWMVTISGAYDLAITSLGVMIQTSRRSSPPHNFNVFLPARLTIYPAEMDANTSTVNTPVMAVGSSAQVTVTGFDRFGNLLISDDGQAAGLVAVLENMCAETPMIVTFQPVSVSPGSFYANIVPDFGGPAKLSVRYDSARIDARTAPLVERSKIPMIVRLAIARPTPDSGFTTGLTQVNVPLLGACQWSQGWLPYIECGWDSTFVSASLSFDPTHRRELTVALTAWTQAVKFSAFAQETWGENPLQTYDMTDTSAVQFDFTTGTHNKTLLWRISPGSNLRFKLENPSFASGSIVVTDEIGRVVLSTVFIDGRPGLSATAFYTWRSQTVPIRQVAIAACSPAPSKFSVTDSSAQRAHVASFTVRGSFQWTSDIGALDGSLFNTMSSSNNNTASVNARQYFYYTAPHASAVVSTAPLLRNASWSHVYVPSTGGAARSEIAVLGSGFDNGQGADKSYMICIFAHMNCSTNGVDATAWSFTSDGCHTFQPQLDGEKRMLSHPPSLQWSPARFVGDSEVRCRPPAVVTTGKYAVLVSMNSQEIHHTPGCFVEYFSIQARTAPVISSIQGGTALVVTLVNGPEMDLPAKCQIGGVHSGLDLVTAERAKSSDGSFDVHELTCISPDAEGFVPSNQWTDIRVSFDDGATFSEAAQFLYFAQPDVGQLFPPIGPTGGGTMIYIELVAGMQYSNPLVGQYAPDFTPVMNETVPKCLFKSSPDKHPHRGDHYFRDGIWSIQQRVSDTTGQRYTAQQIQCISPSNPIPGTSYFVDVSLDGGVTYSYESGKPAEPQQLRYYADTRIVTENPVHNYNALTEFRTAVGTTGFTYDVWFTYSCGYSHTYAKDIKCRYANQNDDATAYNRILDAVPNSLQIGADTINRVTCPAPARAQPSRATVEIALNGVDYTPVSLWTYFVWFGEAVTVGASYVEYVGDPNPQYHFTTRSARNVVVKTVNCEIRDISGNYVSQDDIYDSAMAHASVYKVIRNGNDTQVMSASKNLTMGRAYFDSATLFKPAVGNYMVRLIVDGLVFDELPLTIITGRTNFSNSIIAFSPQPRLAITPGTSLYFQVRTRDSADNYRMDGGQFIRARIEMLDAYYSSDKFGAGLRSRDGTPIVAKPRGGDNDYSRLNPMGYWRAGDPCMMMVHGVCVTSRMSKSANETIAAVNALADGNDDVWPIRDLLADVSGEPPLKDQGNGHYDFNLQPARDKKHSDGSLIRIWGSYKIIVEGREDSEDGTAGQWKELLNSPILANITMLDCSNGGMLDGSLPNEKGDACQCARGYELSQDQSILVGTIEDLRVCSACILGRYKEVQDNAERCQPCPATTSTIVEGAEDVQTCICMQTFYDHRVLEIHCMEEGYYPPEQVFTHDDCLPCPKCVFCFGNSSIAVLPRWYALAPDDRELPQSNMEVINVLPENQKPKININIYRCNTALAGSCIGGIELSIDGHGSGPTGLTSGANGCKLGNGYLTCAACLQGYEADKEHPGECKPCGDVTFKFDFKQFLITTGIIVGAIWAVLKLMALCSPRELLLLKILVSFAQMIQSFGNTYSVKWPPRLLAFVEQLKVFNFDVFEVASTECLFPGVVNYYFKFNTTVAIPVVLIGLVFLTYLNAVRKEKKKRRKQGIILSLLERKILAIETKGMYSGKVFFILIICYLKVSATVLEMFKCRIVEPTADGDPRSYLEADLRLSCEDLKYDFYISFAMLNVFVYPLGVPFVFFFLMYRERDQIHDSINKMKYGFLFGDYHANWYMWEIFDLMRKLSMSGLLIFFHRGSVLQLIVGICIALICVEMHVRIMPYIYPVANMCQLVAFNCIMLTLVGAVLVKVEMNKTEDSQLDVFFCDYFLILCNIGVPLMIICAIGIHIAHYIYRRLFGGLVDLVVGGAARRALTEAQRRFTKEEKKKGALKRLKQKLYNTLWKTQDIDDLLIADEVYSTQQRQKDRTKAEISLLHAKVKLAEKREWLRFVKNQTKDHAEFNEIVQNESIDTFRRTILGDATLDADTEFWRKFGGEDTEDIMGAAFRNKAYMERYRQGYHHRTEVLRAANDKIAQTLEGIDDLRADKQINKDFRVVREYNMSEDGDQAFLDSESQDFEQQEEQDFKKKEVQLLGETVAQAQEVARQRFERSDGKGGKKDTVKGGLDLAV
jgi:hypothetical protein